VYMDELDARITKEFGNQISGVSEERRDKFSCRLSSRSKSNRRLAAAAFRKLRIPIRQPTTTMSTTKMSPSRVDIEVGEERCHTFLRWADYTRFVTLQRYLRVGSWSVRFGAMQVSDRQSLSRVADAPVRSKPI